MAYFADIYNYSLELLEITFLLLIRFLPLASCLSLSYSLLKPLTMKFSLLLFTASALAAPKQQRRGVQADVRDLPVVREGSALLLDGKPWKAVGPNVFWLGLDEDAGYPTKGRITEAMATVKALGGTAIRAHTLGVSAEHPLSVMPSQGKVNEKAFDTIDWAVYQAREYGLRLLVPLTDNWVRWARRF